MYVTLMHTLRAFFGADSFLRFALIGTLALLVLAMAAAITPAFRAIQERWRSEGGWRGSLASMGTASPCRWRKSRPTNWTIPLAPCRLRKS